MKKIKIIIISLSCLFSFSVFGQWNNSGYNATTGDLHVGQQTRFSELRINGESEAELSFWFAASGMSSIRGTRENNGGLDFMTLDTGPYKLATRMKVRSDLITMYPEVITYNNLTIGEHSSAETGLGAGKKLIFMGVGWNYSMLQMYRYNRSAVHSDLRVDIGTSNGGNDRFVIGNLFNGTAAWKSWFTVLNSGRVGIGTETPQYALDVIGTIRAREIIVNTDGADFVFDKDYVLPSLVEVKAHIEEKKHLPDIPSAVEMQQNGVGVSELSTKLLQKVEELTLYVIQQNEMIESLTKEVEELRNQK